MSLLILVGLAAMVAMAAILLVVAVNDRRRRDDLYEVFQRDKLRRRATETSL